LIEVPLPDQFDQLRLKQTADHAQKANRDGKQMPSNKVGNIVLTSTRLAFGETCL